jgi:FlaA1/EpsC-like NDP-sugar epimerase
MLDMGEQIKIIDLAENLVRLSGLEPYRDIPIAFTGLRPGEKLHEELMSAVESTVPSGVAKIDLVQTDEVDSASIRDGVARLLAVAARGEWVPILAALRVLVPEYSASGITLMTHQASMDSAVLADVADATADANGRSPNVAPRRSRSDTTREVQIPLVKDA